MSADRTTLPAAVGRWADRTAGSVASWRPLAGDLSARAYYRGARADGSSVVLAVYPPSLAADCGRFLASTALLEGAGLPVPKVLAADCERGTMLVEDLGPATLADTADKVGRRGVLAYFARATELIEHLTRIPRQRAAELNPPLGQALLAQELELARRAFLKPGGLLDGLELLYEECADRLCRRLASLEPVPCHRDFMVRNLVPVGDAPGLAVLDHQGLRLGPPAYDLASLLNDTVFLDADDEEKLLAARLPANGRTSYHRAAAQRTLKAVGTYADFERRGNARHAKLIRPTFERALRHLARCPETEVLAGALRAGWGGLC